MKETLTAEDACNAKFEFGLPSRHGCGPTLTSMKPAILAAFALAVSQVLSADLENPVSVADSGSEAIDRLVLGLVSRRPAPLPMGGRLPGDSISGESRLINHSPRCATDEVEDAFQKLKAIAPRDYHFLLKHANDDRYSYSIIGPHGSPTFSGWMNYSVGQAVDEILSNEMEWVGGYKWRETPGSEGATPPTFSDYIEAQGGYKKWAASVSSLSRTRIDIQFLDWCMRMEAERGFKDDAQRNSILERYQARKQEVERAGESEGSKVSD